MQVKRIRPCRVETVDMFWGMPYPSGFGQRSKRGWKKKIDFIIGVMQLGPCSLAASGRLADA